MLIAKYQALGSAITAFVVEWILAFLYIFYCLKKFDLPINIKWMLKFVVYFILFFVINFLLKNLEISLLISMPINLITFIILVYGFRFWDKKIVMSYFKTQN